MTDGAIIAGDAAAAAVETANAIKASGAVVRVEARDFEAILGKVEAPLVVHAEGGVFSRKYHYLTSYKGLIFYTRDADAPAPAAEGGVDRRPEDLDPRVTAATPPDGGSHFWPSIRLRYRRVWRAFCQAVQFDSLVSPSMADVT